MNRHRIASILFLAILGGPAAAAGVPAATASAPAPASLDFVSDARVVGARYGIDAIDGHARVYGQRASARVAPGRRDVAYVCPGAEGVSRLSYTFEAGRTYALACTAGQVAEVRSTGC